MKQAQPERTATCIVCARSGVQTLAVLWNGYGEGVCGEACARVYNDEVLADWREICTLAAEIRVIERQLS
jgi:hypothetical protein